MHYRRRKKLILPRLQLRLTGAILGVAVLGLLLQFLLIYQGLLDAARSIPGAGGMLVDRIPHVTVQALLGTLLAVVPALALVGVWTTFRVAGPLYRFNIFLRAVIEGRQTEPCRLRDGDELKDLCELLNLVTERARAEALEEESEEETSKADDAKRRAA